MDKLHKKYVKEGNEIMPIRCKEDEDLVKEELEGEINDSVKEFEHIHVKKEKETGSYLLERTHENYNQPKNSFYLEKELSEQEIKDDFGEEVGDEIKWTP